MKNWKINSWRNYPVKHIPEYPDKKELDGVLSKIKDFPPLVFAGETRHLKEQLSQVVDGKAFLLQGGDCAESFAEFHPDNIRDTFKLILQMSLVLTYSASLPVIKLGRIAGQFSKPRSSPLENIDGVELPSYLGDNIIELAKKINIKHLLIASSSSVYGANKKSPFKEIDKTETQLSIYAATKKSTESIAHSYSNIWKIPTTVLRFFTVYGPWGRPDMALFKFTKGIINKKKIDIYNQGKMYRDFTYIDDIVDSVCSLINKEPNLKELGKIKNDSLSPVAPFRIVNIGNTKKVYLLNFISTLEKELGIKAIRNYMPMQKGDVKTTLSDTTLLKKLTGYKPKTNYKTGIKKFLKWYLKYYN